MTTTEILRDRLFAATTLNVTTALADDLNSAGFGKLQVRRSFQSCDLQDQFAVHARDEGERISKPRHGRIGQSENLQNRCGVCAGKSVRWVLTRNRSRALVKMQIFKVTPEFVTEMRNEGLNESSDRRPREAANLQDRY